MKPHALLANRQEVEMLAGLPSLATSGIYVTASCTILERGTLWLGALNAVFHREGFRRGSGNSTFAAAL